MFWDKKDEKSQLPDLPPLKASKLQWNEDEEEEVVEKHALPTFPDSPSHNNFSQAAIKEAINDKEPLPELDEEEFPVPKKTFKTVEMEEWQPHEHQSLRETDEPNKLSLPPIKIKPLPTSFPEKNKDIFIKIDKFRSAKKAIEKTQSSLDEIHSLLGKIRETKMREEQELSAWERDLAQAKTSINEIRENIFEKVE